MNLPTTAGAWRRPDAAKRIDERTIFSYMDGAGEMYLGYRFDHLDVHEYNALERGSILVELYWMRSSDDAFGLLSTDWGGEPVSLQEDLDVRSPAAKVRSPGAGPTGTVVEWKGPAPPGHALYGAGLLRLWSDTLYARVLTMRETPESREQVIAIGRAIVAGRPVSAPPELLKRVPARIPGVAGYQLRGDRFLFLRSHLVLNSAYFLSSQNILDLSPACEAVLAPYESPRRSANRSARVRPYLLVIRYPDGATARRAFTHFVSAYLPDLPTAAQAATAPEGAHRIEKGWVGYALRDRVLALALDAPDEATASQLVSARP